LLSGAVCDAAGTLMIMAARLRRPLGEKRYSPTGELDRREQ
jgi:hypothetical protein